jgi:hypothetical protein
MSAARVELKRIADQLGDDEARIVLRIARGFTGRGNLTRTLRRALEDRIDVEGARKAETEAREKGTIPWDRVKAEAGL